MSFARIASEFRTSWDRYRTYREAVRQLSSLDDRQLQDIGVERGRKVRPKLKVASWLDYRRQTRRATAAALAVRRGMD